MGQSEPLVSLSNAAAERVRFLIDREGNADLKMRISVSGGGCSGFQYGFAFDADENPDDLVLEKSGVKVLIDSMSILYLAGSEIDFVEELVGSAFKITNPNAQAQCGCGSSFAV